MVSIKKYVPCKCGTNNSFDFSSDMSVEDLTLSARCPSCSASIQISISSLLSTPSQPAPASPQQQLLGDDTSKSDSEAAHDAHVAENVDTALREIFKNPF